MTVHIEAKRIEKQNIQILFSERRINSSQPIVIISVIFLVPNKGFGWFKIIDSLCEVSGFDKLPVRKIFCHSEAKFFAQRGNEQFRKTLQRIPVLIQPPETIFELPAFFVASNVGQFRGTRCDLRFLVLPGITGEAAGQSDFGKAVLREAHLIIGKVFSILLHPVVVRDRSAVNTQNSCKIAAVCQTKNLLQNAGIGAMTVNGAVDQPSLQIIVCGKIQWHTGFIQRDDSSFLDLRNRCVSTH